MKDAGLPCSQDWDEAWRCVKQVWASKWNERAYLSRRSNGIPHDALLMAVLVQAVVEAEYSFVIHTANRSPAHGTRSTPRWCSASAKPSSATTPAKP